MLPTTILAAHHRRKNAAGSHSAEAYARLKAKITSLELPPATPIDENALMAELGLGRTPIREALQRLAHENLVVIYPRRGTLVADLNLSDLQKVFELRLELEPFTARLAAERAAPEEVAAMRALLVELEAVLAAGDHRQLILLDHQAHALLAQAAHNEFLEEALDRLYSHVLRLWHVSLHQVSRLPQAVAEHREIVDAVQARDGERAARSMRAHVAGFQSEFMSAAAAGPASLP
ncbi:MAG: GntR family transcriptional regulator [Anaerolineales bacterium]|nr:GntR family transcriptional regulator [Anaerolineales bacterium]